MLFRSALYCARMVDIGTEWNLEAVMALDVEDSTLVDIGTEWNLESVRCICASFANFVDIGTEWNLESFSDCLLYGLKS